jgi:hypothetical protein
MGDRAARWAAMIQMGGKFDSSYPKIPINL